MSKDFEDNDVILIAPPVANQDGSQTFYLLDPCSSSHTDEPSKIELIDLTAEVKNTGAIAVLSTNRDTGALEITVTNKIKEEEMELADKNNSPELGKSGLPESSDQKYIVIDDDLKTYELKDEENEDVDIEEIHEVIDSNPKLKNESKSLSLGVDTSNQDIPNEQDDEIDEDTLYIDDAKFTELHEELAQENLETLKNLGEMIDSPRDTVPEQTKETFFDTTIKEVNIPHGDVDKLVGVIVGENCDKLELNQPHFTGHDHNNVQSSHIPHSLHEEEHILPDIIDEKEYVESTNTALTLLELAGGTSLRNSAKTEFDVELTELDHNESSKLAKPVEPNEHNSTLDNGDVAPQSDMTTTLITLQPVPLDPPANDFICKTFSKDSSEHSQTPNADYSQEKNSEVLPLTPKVDNSYKMNSEIQKLIEGDIPRLGMQVGKIRSASISSPIVTQDDIAKEILARSIQKCPYTEPVGGDSLFAKKLTYRLASRLVPPEKVVSSPEQTLSEKSHRCATPNEKPGSIPEKKQGNATLVNLSFTKPDNFLNSSETNANLPKKDAISDKIKLLKILEDDPDDPPSNLNEKLLEQKAKMKMTKGARPPLIKLHPELEKELALKQLEDFSNKSRKRKGSSIHDIYKNIPKKERILKKDKKHNNNLNSKVIATQTLAEGRNSLMLKTNKKLKNGMEDVTLDRSRVTESLPIEQSADGIQSKDSKFLKQYTNKRHSRNSETPPREIPMEILLNGDEDELPEGDLNTSKNKIFKATHPRKRQEELKIKRQKHFANVLQRNPQKRRGRPPKKKPILPSDDFLHLEVLKHNNPKKIKEEEAHELSNAAQESDIYLKSEKPQKTKKMREIERLLGDEGAINMLYSVEQKRSIGSEPKRGMLPSYRRKKKDLILKTKLVKSAVLKLTTSPIEALGRVSLRGQPNKDEDQNENINEASLRKMSVDSHDSHISLSSPPGEVFSFPAKIVPAEASRIIRRHSSSSNYSSRSNSPRRPSTDGERSTVLPNEIKTSDIGQGDNPTPINCNKPQKSKQALQEERSVSTPPENNVLSVTPKEQVTVQEKIIIENKKRLFRTPISEKHIVKTPIPPKNSIGRPRKNIISKEEIRKTTGLSTSLAAAVDDFTKENKIANKNIPLETPKKSEMEKYNKTSNSKVYRRTAASVKVVKQDKQSVIYNEITLKRHNHLVEIVLSPVSTKLKNALNAKVLQELTTVVNGLASDDNCRVILITSCGSVFCQGVDFFSLIQPTPEKRKCAALEMAVAIKEFIKAVALFTKPLIAGVHAPSVGLGTTMLPLFDLIYASSEATFHTPYARLGQVPEGAATLTLPSLLGASLTSELLFACRKLTADDALHHGLVTRLLPTENFHEELLTIATSIASQSSQSMGATKALLRHNLLSSLETTLVSETHLLIQHWTSEECQSNFNKYLQDEEQSLTLQPT